MRLIGRADRSPGSPKPGVLTGGDGGRAVNGGCLLRPEGAFPPQTSRVSPRPPSVTLRAVLEQFRRISSMPELDARLLANLPALDQLGLRTPRRRAHRQARRRWRRWRPPGFKGEPGTDSRAQGILRPRFRAQRRDARAAPGDRTAGRDGDRRADGGWTPRLLDLRLAAAAVAPSRSSPTCRRATAIATGCRRRGDRRGGRQCRGCSASAASSSAPARGADRCSPTKSSISSSPTRLTSRATSSNSCARGPASSTWRLGARWRGGRLAAYRAIAAGVPGRLRPGAALMVEVGSEQGIEVGAMLAMWWTPKASRSKDPAGLDRVVIAHQLTLIDAWR